MTAEMQCPSDYSSLFKMVSDIAEEEKRQSMITGKLFSPFSLGLIPVNETLTSRILAIVFDPKGCHGQGVYFLRRFLGLFSIPEAIGLTDDAVHEVKTEKVTYGAADQRRLDIYIECDNFYIGIENKIDAGDQPTQLTDYLNWLKARAGTKPYYLIYLTPDGREASEWSLTSEARELHAKHYFNLSWPDLLNMLMEASRNVPFNIANFINDFCNYMKKEKIMDTTQDNFDTGSQLINCLANQTTDKQWQAAFNIYQNYLQAEQKIITDWLTRLKDALKNSVQGEINVVKRDLKEYHEFDWFSVSYSDLKTSVEIFQPGYKLGAVSAYALSWGVAFWTWEFPANQEALTDPWCKDLMKEFDAQTLTGNMVTIELIAKVINPGCYWPLDPPFIEKIRKGGVPYLYDEILSACLKIEKLAKNFKSNDEEETS